MNPEDWDPEDTASPPGMWASTARPIKCASPRCGFDAEIVDPDDVSWCLWDMDLSAHPADGPGWTPIKEHSPDWRWGEP